MEKTITIEDLAFHRIAHSERSGAHSYHGRMVPNYHFVETYKTTVGNFSPEEWNRIAMETVIKSGQFDLYERIFAYCQKNCAWLKSEKDISEHVLSCMASHAYEHWSEFHYQMSLNLE